MNEQDFDAIRDKELNEYLDDIFKDREDDCQERDLDWYDDSLDDL